MKGSQNIGPDAVPLTKVSTYQPYSIIRRILGVSKFIFLGLTLLIFLDFVWVCVDDGDPELWIKGVTGITAGIHQGFKCGWTSEVENPWTCDR